MTWEEVTSYRRRRALNDLLNLPIVEDTLAVSCCRVDCPNAFWGIFLSCDLSCASGGTCEIPAMGKEEIVYPGGTL